MIPNKSTIGFLSSSTSLGGLELNAARLAHWMKDREWNVFFFAVPETPLYAECERRGLPMVPIERNWKYFDLRRAFQLYRKLTALDIRTVYFRDNRDISLLGLARVFFGSRIKLIFQQGMVLGVDKKDIVHTLRFSRIDAWLTQLEYLAQNVKDRTRFDPEKIHVVPLGIELETFTANSDRSSIRSKLNIPVESPVLGLIGRFDPKKGQLFTVRAFARIREKVSDALLVMVGDVTQNEGEAYMDAVRREITAHHLEDSALIRPFTQDVAEYYQCFDVFALPSQKETAGTVLKEAMACGLPVIATDAGGPPEIVDYGKAGMLYTPGDTDAFVRETVRLLSDPDERKVWGQKAREHAVNTFSKERQCEMIEKIIKTVTSNEYG